MVAPSDESATKRLNTIFDDVSNGRRTITLAHEGRLFINTICRKSDPKDCAGRLAANQPAAVALRASVQFDISINFINGPFDRLLGYLQDPTLKQLCSGEVLRRLLALLVDPPILWNAFADAQREKKLSTGAELSFTWLLLELLSWSSPPDNVLTVAQEVASSGDLTKSLSNNVRVLGHRLPQVLSAKNPNISIPDWTDNGPGGRHNNDSTEFREIVHLYDRWRRGLDAGVFRHRATRPKFWNLILQDDEPQIKQRRKHLEAERVTAIIQNVNSYDEAQSQPKKTLDEQRAQVLRSKRIVACTTTRAAMHAEFLQNTSPEVVPVKEAGEILKSHVLTARGHATKQPAMIGHILLIFICLLAQLSCSSNDCKEIRADCIKVIAGENCEPPCTDWLNRVEEHPIDSACATHAVIGLPVSEVASFDQMQECGTFPMCLCTVSYVVDGVTTDSHSPPGVDCSSNHFAEIICPHDATVAIGITLRDNIDCRP